MNKYLRLIIIIILIGLLLVALEFIIMNENTSQQFKDKIEKQ